MKLTRFSRFLFLWVLVMITAKGMAQQKVHVVTKTIKQDLEQLLDSGIVVQGKKAKVEITGWDKPFIRIEMDLISKHPRKQVAEQELSFIQYAITRSNDHYIIRNLFYAATGSNKVRSNLSVTYRIFIPVAQKVVIANDYGSMHLKNLYGDLSIDSKFSEVYMSRFFGRLQATLNYSEISAENVEGNLRFDTRKTDINLKDFAGDVAIKNYLGKLSLSPSYMLRSLDVDSRNGKVELTVRSLDAFNFDIRVNSSYITLPENQNRLVQVNELLDEHAFRLRNDVGKANINITNLLDPVTINYASNEPDNEE